jgi:hypothetical protein
MSHPATKVMDLVSETSQGRLNASRLRGNVYSIFWVILAILLLAAAFLASGGWRYARYLVTPFDDRSSNELGRMRRLPAVPAGARMPAPEAAVWTSGRLIEAPRPEIASQFVRMWRVSGPDICKALREGGIETSEWRAASMRSTSYECYFQRVYKQDEARPLSSTYLKIKGNAKGDIFEMRGKILGPKTDAEGRLDSSLMRIFEILVQQVRWSDLQETLVPIRSLQDVEYRGFGASFNFARETANESGFTFELSLEGDPGPQMRTRSYFSPDRWVRMPDPPLSDSPPLSYRQGQSIRISER